MRLAPICLLAVFLFPLVSCSTGKSVSTPEENAKLLSKAAFCDAYVTRNSDKRDHRPSPDEESYPFLKESYPGNSILGKGDAIVDVAAVASRVTAQARVSQEQISRLTTALYKTDSFHPMSACYHPHHALVFYTEDGNPLCCVEICFSCNSVETAPKLRRRKSETGLAFTEGADLVAMAEIFQELKLPLTPYKSLEALKRDKAERSRKHRVFLKNRAEEKEQISRRELEQ